MGTMSSRIRSSGEKHPLSAFLRIWNKRTLSTGQTVEFIDYGNHGDEPIVVLGSMEFQAPPPWQFFIDAKKSGFRTIVIRRPGFGASTRCKSFHEQVHVLDQFLKENAIAKAVFLASGTGCATAIRLAESSRRASRLLLCNYALDGFSISTFEQDWLNTALRRAIESRPGAAIALAAVKRSFALSSVTNFVMVITSHSKGDQKFIEANPAEFADAGQAFSSLSAECLFIEMSALKTDQELIRALHEIDIPKYIVHGSESKKAWLETVKQRASETGCDLICVPDSDFFCAYCDFNSLGIQP